MRLTKLGHECRAPRQEHLWIRAWMRSCLRQETTFWSTQSTDRQTRTHANTEMMDMINSASTREDAARFRSLRGRGAGSWLDTVLSAWTQQIPLGFFGKIGMLSHLSESTWQVWLWSFSWQRRLSFANMQDGRRPRTHTHNAITADCLRNLHLNHKQETQFRYSDSNNLPDITVFDQQSGTTLDLDIAVVHPWCSDVLGKAEKEDGAAAARREEIKTRKYQQEKLAVIGVVASCKPLVLEIFGRWGWSAQNYLCSLSALYQDEDGRNNPVEFKAIWRKRMSIILQKNI